MIEINKTTMRELAYLFGRYYDENAYIDADDAVEQHLLVDRHGSREDVAERTLEQLRWLLEVCDGDDEALGDATELLIGLPLAESYHAWCRYLEELIPQVVAHPDQFLDRSPYAGVQVPRSSQFFDREQGKTVMQAVMERNRTLVEAWLENQNGFRRLHLYAEFAEPVGDVVFNTPGEPGKTEQVSGAVALLSVGRDGRPAPVCAYPEISLDIEARARYPELTLLFGGYFGQEYRSLDHSTILAEGALNSGMPDRNRPVVARRLQELLTEDDEQLRASVRSLGSYVEPLSLRRWVTGLHRRMTRVDWSRPR